MPPPQLPGKAPILAIIHPTAKALLCSLWENFDLPVLDGLGCCGCHLCRFHPPLWFQSTLDEVLGSVTAWYTHRVAHPFHVQPFGFELLNDRGPSIETLYAGKAARVVIQSSIVIEDADDIQTVSLTHGKVVEVMSRGDFDGPSAKVHRDALVRHDGKETV